jgi:hypothetical protein
VSGRNLWQVACCVVLIAMTVALRQSSHGTVAVAAAPEAALTKSSVAAAFTWDPAMAPGDRALIERALGRARPEAQRLIGLVDGLTTLRSGPAPAGNLGVTDPQRDGTFVVTFDLATTFHDLGERGVTRLVMHELGHVVDFALVPAELRPQLDAGVPPGLPCPAGTRIGSCAPEEERFAESFAKWAMNDLGLDLYIGYAVPAPVDIEKWAEPLLSLGA